MPNCTDLKTVDAEKAAGLVLLAVANHFTTTNPTAVLESNSLLVCIGAEAYNLAGRSVNGDASVMSRAALGAAPEVPEGTTRGEAALLLRKAAVACGYDWTNEDNQRTIPTVPGPRTEPSPPHAAEAAQAVRGPRS
ncbi:hypothetical protein ACFRFL_13995 [Streptomyces sp. NPDC056708]|uniref:hypothetical protein n=1 Tax=unclassified Streptomyces TaxID=2593676 RepID=UPI0036AD9919